MKASGSSRRKNLYNWAWSLDQDCQLKKFILDIVLQVCIVTEFFSSLLITGKIFKCQMHSKLYNLPQSYFFLSTED